MSVYRSRVRLYADVLRAVRDGAGDEGFTRISAVMRKANTSYAKLSGYSMSWPRAACWRSWSPAM